MNNNHLVLLLCIAALSVAATYHDGETFEIEDQTFNFTTVSSSGHAAFFTSEHGDFAIRDGKCTSRDVYLLCVQNISDDVVEHYPHRYEITFSYEKLCEDCTGWGNSCEEDVECEGACVHNTCRPSSPWCGDDVCDEQEHHATCSQDCPAPQNQSAQNITTAADNQSEETNQSAPEPTNETEETTNTSTQPPAQQQPTPVDGPAAQVVEDSPNWLGAGLTIFGGLALILVVFTRKKHKDEPSDDLYSYRK